MLPVVLFFVVGFSVRLTQAPRPPAELTPAQAAASQARLHLQAHPELLAGRKLSAGDLPVVHASAFRSSALVLFGPQSHRGIPIESTEIVVRLEDGRVCDVAGRWAAVPEGLVSRPKVPEAAARAALEPWVAAEPGSLVYLLNEGPSPRLAWRLRAAGRMLYVDAETGRVLKKLEPAVS